jgi:hypothetical protein
LTCLTPNMMSFSCSSLGVPYPFALEQLAKGYVLRGQDQLVGASLRGCLKVISLLRTLIFESADGGVSLRVRPGR